MRPCTDIAAPTLAFRFATILVALSLASCSTPVDGPAPQQVADVYVADPEGIVVEPWAEGLEVPWSLVFLPDGRALVSERPGRIRLIEDGRLAERPYAQVTAAEGNPATLVDTALSVFFSGEGGLMGLAVHPRFSETPYVYAMHTYRRVDGSDGNRIVRFVDQGQTGKFESVVVDDIPAANFHDGGRIAFGPDGMLYIATGDASKPDLSQDLSSLAGKILRVTPDGAIPEDNPFPGSPVWALGLRNPQGLAWHPQTGQLFASDHGPTSEFGMFARDEINAIEPGGNYGWPEAVGAPGLPEYVDPIVVWLEEAVPPAGIEVVGDDLFVATLENEALVRMSLRQRAQGWEVARIEHWFAEERADGRFGRLRDVTLGPDGALYLTSSNRDGRTDPAPGDDRIYRLPFR